MKPETVERIMQALDAVLNRFGGRNWDEAMQFAKEYFNSPEGIMPFKVGEANRLSTRAELEKCFFDSPEPTQSELEQRIKEMQKLPGAMRKASLKAVKDLPRDVGGRHSVRGTPQEQEMMVREVLSLYKKGVRVTDALKRVARKHGISLSSMQRIWAMRKKSDDEEPSE